MKSPGRGKDLSGLFEKIKGISKTAENAGNIIKTFNKESLIDKVRILAAERLLGGAFYKPCFFNEKDLLDDLASTEYDSRYETLYGPGVKLSIDRDDNGYPHFHFRIGSDSSRNWLVLRRRFNPLSGINRQGIGLVTTCSGRGWKLRVALEGEGGDKIMTLPASEEESLTIFPFEQFKPAPWNSSALPECWRPLTFSIQIVATGKTSKRARGSLLLKEILLFGSEASSRLDEGMPVGDFSLLNDATMNDYYWSGTGPSASMMLTPNYLSVDGREGVLRLDYVLDDRDNTRAWVSLKRHKLEKALDMNNSGPLLLWIQGDKSETCLEILFYDSKGGRSRYEHRLTHLGHDWNKLQIRTVDLIPWDEKGKGADSGDIISWEFRVVPETGIESATEGNELKEAVKGSLFLADLSVHTLPVSERGRRFINILSELPTLNRDEVGRLFWYGAGTDASIKVEPDHVDEDGVGRALRVIYSVNSENPDNNWMVMKRKDFSKPCDWNMADGVGMWIKGDGNGGLIRLTIFDASGNKASYTDLKVLNEKRWTRLNLSFNSFTGDKLDFTRIAGFEFYFGLDWKKPPLQGEILFNDFSAMETSPGGRLFRKSGWVNLAEDLRFMGADDLENYFWYSAGPDSSAELSANAVDPEGIRGCLRLDYSIKSSDSDKNWISLRRHDYSRIQDWSSRQGITLWARGEGDIGRLRITVRDDKGHEASCSDWKVLGNSRWLKMEMPFQAFITTADSKGGISPDFSRIKGFDVYIGLSSSDKTARGSLYINDFQAPGSAGITRAGGSYANILESLLFAGARTEEVLWYRSGEDSKLQLTSSAVDPEGVRGCLRVDYSIETRDSSNNWVSFGSNPFAASLDWSDFDGITLWIRGSGSGGRMRLTIVDENDAAMSCSDYRVIPSRGWNRLEMPFAAFKLIDSDDDTVKIDLSRIKGFEFYIGLDWQAPPVESTIFLRPLENIEKAAPSRLDDVKRSGGNDAEGRINLFDDLRFLSVSTLNDFYWWRSGPEASLQVLAGAVDSEGVRGSLRLDYEITTDDAAANWVSLGHVDYSEPRDWSSNNNISLWIRGDGQGGQLRLSLRDNEGRSLQCSDFKVLGNTRWTRVDFPIEAFHPAPGLPDNSNIDLGHIVSWDLYIGLDWKKPPLKGTIFVNSFQEMPQLSLAELTGGDRSLVNLAGDLRFLNDRTVKDYFWWGSSEGAQLTVETNVVDPDDVKGCMALRWNFPENSGAGASISLKRNELSEPVDMNNARGLGLWLRGGYDGPELKLTLYDLSGNKATVQDPRILGNEGWKRWEVPKIELLKEEGFDISRVTAWALTITPGWIEKPAEGVLFLNDFQVLDSPLGMEEELAEKWVNLAADFKFLNQATVRDIFWWGAGPDSALEIFPNTIDDEGTQGCLRLNYSIKSPDSETNWVILKHTPFREPRDWSSISGVFTWVKGDSQGGQFRVLLRDRNGEELILSDFQALNHSKWVRLQMPKDRFVIPPWNKGNSDGFDWKGVTDFEIYLGLNWKRPPLDGTVWINDFRSTLPSQGETKDDRVFISLLNDLNCSDLVELAERYWWDNGPDSSLTLEPGAVDPQGIGGLMKAEYEIKTENSEQNWISLVHHNLSESRHWNSGVDDKANWSFADGITFWLKGDGQGGRLRITVEDRNSRRASWSDRQALSQTRWQQLRISFSDFIPEDGHEMLDFAEVNNFEFYVGLDWKKPPVKGVFYLTDLKPAPFTERTVLGDYRSQEQAAIREKYRGRAYKKVLELARPSRRIDVDGKLMPVKEVEEILSRKFGTPSKRTESEILPFGMKDMQVEASKKEGRWGLSKAALFVEPTNLCNLQCIMCNHGDNSFDRPLGVMKFHEFKRIVDEIVRDRLNLWEFGPYWLGESFIHPQIEDMLAYASEAKAKMGTFRRFSIHTNGEMLEDRHIESILDSKLDSILFSMDAATRETYEKIRVGGEFQRVEDNVQKLLSLRAARRQTHPRVLVQFIVMDENVHEIKSFAEKWRSRGIEDIIFAGRPEDNPFGTDTKVNLLFPETVEDGIFIKALEPNAFTKGQAHREVIPDTTNVVRRRACGSLWRMMSVGWDGTATACCRDDQLNMPIGNVFQEGLSAVWYGEKLRRYRIAQIFENFEETPKCVDCVNWVKNFISDDDIVDWLKSIGEKDLVKLYLKKIGKAE